MKNYRYRVAEFCFEVSVPESLDINRLIPSFIPFQCGMEAQEACVFCFMATEESVAGWEQEELMLEEMQNDLGYVQLYALTDGYGVVLRHTQKGTQHFMRATADFAQVKAILCWEDPYVGSVMTSMLRIAFSQVILARQAVSVHASVVFLDGYAYLFLGKSGTGKSTHAALWMKHFPGCGLLNDDNPVVRIKNECAWVYGTPWSGKTPCYKNLCYPVGGIVRLRQAKENRFCHYKEETAFVGLLPSCTVIRQDTALYNNLCDTLASLCELVPIGGLECLPDRDAAFLCRKELLELLNKNFNH